MSNIVDITYAVSEKEAQGLKRMKNLDTGEMWWAEEIEATIPEPECIPLNKEEPVVHVVEPLEFGPVIKPRGKKRGA